MALIRNANASTIAREAIVLDLGDLHRQAADIVRQARADAAKIVAAAHVERTRIIAGGEEQGRAAGIAKGLEEGRAIGREEALLAARAEHSEALAKIETAWADALSEFAARREDMIQGATRDTVNLAVLIAGRVVKRAIEVQPRLVEDQLAAVLAVVVRPTELVIRINPADRALVEKALPRLLGAAPAVKHAEIVDDPAVERSGCIAQSRADAARGDAGGGEIDARIGTQLDRIVEAILPRDSLGGREGVRSW